MLHATAVPGSDSHQAEQPVEQQTPRREAAWPRALSGPDRRRIPIIQRLTAGTILTALVAGCGGARAALTLLAAVGTLLRRLRESVVGRVIEPPVPRPPCAAGAIVRL
jgi:hypothetical protein